MSLTLHYLGSNHQGWVFAMAKKYFCQDSGKTGKNGKNRQRLAIFLHCYGCPM